MPTNDKTPPTDDEIPFVASEELLEEELPMNELTAEIENLKAEKQAAFEKLAQVQADFANSRRRLEADADQRLAYANQELCKSILPILDNFERALSQDPAKVQAADILKGMQLVHDQLAGVLAKQSVEAIAPKVGDDFDPNLHQALMQQQSDLPEGKVTLLLQKGYSIKGRVIRAAQVAVSAAT
jgi:molecular chaperone GrpE